MSSLQTLNKYHITVDVETHYLSAQSAPEEDRFVFAYTVTIKNLGHIPAQLMTRHWIIEDAHNKIQEVRGEGVIGEQPNIEPGMSYRYSSGAMIETPVGTMQGSYQMVAEDGEAFDAEIAPFTLAMPRTLH